MATGSRGKPLEALWDTIKRHVADNATHHTYVRIPAARTDVDGVDVPLDPYGSYFRVWLSELFLAKSVAWGVQWFPAVHSEVRLQFGDRKEATFSFVTRPPQDGLGRGVKLNYRLTELLPYNGGVVEIEAALLALRGSDYLATAVDVLQGFSSLVTPPLGPVLAVAEKVATGTRDLLQASGGTVRLALHQSFSTAGQGAASMRTGYIAVILAPHGTLAEERLSVAEGRLHYREQPSSPASPLGGYDYMLFRIEGQKERDDWRLRNIEEPLMQAITALSQGETAKAAAYKTVALAAAWQSPDLAVRDRRRVVEAIKAELSEIEGSGLGAVGPEERDLGAIVAARALPVAAATGAPELTADEVFS